MSDLHEFGESEIVFSFDQRGTHLFSIEETRRSFAKRFVSISHAINALLKGGEIVPAVILARALIETIAMGCLFSHDLNKLVRTGSVDAFEERVMKYIAGMKGRDPGPVHIMDAIRHLKKLDENYLDYLGAQYPFMEKMLTSVMGTENEGLDLGGVKKFLSVIKLYDELSEVAHPNALGTQMLFPCEDNKHIIYPELKKKFEFYCSSSIWHGHHLLRALGESNDVAEQYRLRFVSAGWRKN